MIGGIVPGTRSLWDGARLRLRVAYTQVGSADSTQVRITAVEVEGSYVGAPPVDMTPPALSSATGNGSAVDLVYGEPLDPGSVPTGGAFSLKVDGNSGPSVSTVSIAGVTVTLALSSPLPGGAAVRLTYVPPATGAVQDQAGNDVAGMLDNAVTNITPVLDTTPPVLSSATASGSAVALAYGEPLDPGAVPAPSAFALTVDGNPGPSVSSVAIAGQTVTLTLDTVLPSGGAFCSPTPSPPRAPFETRPETKSPH